MADMYEKRSGKATRQKHEKDRRDKAARRAGGRVKYGADADKQYE